MCGRYVLTDLEKFLQRQAWIRRPAQEVIPPPRYNLAPMQDVLAVVRDKEQPGHGVVKPFRWGLVPSWAQGETVGGRMINARAESLLSKGSFRKAMARRRCLVPADGFYEWKKPERRGQAKQPYVFRMKGDAPFAFAGLWEVWHDPHHADREDRPPLFTCTIITGEPNALVAPVHDRMPVILPEERYRDWIDVDNVPAEQAAELLRPFPAERMHAYPIGRRVGNVGNDDAALLEPAEADPPAKAREEGTLF